ncbi:hypothetical protein SAMN05421780_10819 [Flexibacter flexilis DSM 6793]|uniref:Uncharacterized protein n=1 Tax=Flexibacter flexilis DSM 6793 TaxID=927664 RepID=A0A1I1L9G6_9BACT|nr:hypothetical protein SAMN05421780_10819 [Flexibacter flexilis DSM 6793]
MPRLRRSFVQKTYYYQDPKPKGFVMQYGKSVRIEIFVAKGI